MQTSLFENILPFEVNNHTFSKATLMISDLVNLEKIVKTEKRLEFHNNGQLWIDGQIALVKDEYKHEYDYRTGFSNYIGLPVVRIGIWTKYFDNGQLAWQIDYSDGSYESWKKSGKRFPSFRKDGTGIISY